MILMIIRSSDGEWKVVSNGLSEPKGTLISILAANPIIAGEFYAAHIETVLIITNKGPQ
jgi:hypothetical protein